MKNRSFLAAALACLGFCTGHSLAADRPPPNVVIFFADDMGRGDVGVYGCRDIATPNIDRLAGHGIRLEHYYAAAPMCSPSRAALLTGRYPHRAGLPSNASSQPGAPGMPGSEITFAELARTRGYATAIIGKWHVGSCEESRPNAQGFDRFFGHHGGCIDYYSHWMYWTEPHIHDLHRDTREVREDGVYMTDIVTRESIRFIDENKNKPFLLYVAYNAPHYPLQAPEHFCRQYAHLPGNRRNYAPLVAALDDSVGKVLACLNGYGLTENTLVFFLSDNGVSSEIRNNGIGGDTGGFREAKFSLFEGGIRMPGIVSWPAVLPRCQVRDQLAIHHDVFPTIAAAIGAELPTDRVIDGSNMLPWLEDPSAATGHEILFWESWNQKAVRQGKWKLVKNGILNMNMSKKGRAEGDDAIFLADLEADPAETTNLRREHPDIVESLLARHDSWREEIEQDLGSR